MSSGIQSKGIWFDFEYLMNVNYLTGMFKSLFCLDQIKACTIDLSIVNICLFKISLLYDTFSLSILCENGHVPSICWHVPRRNLVCNTNKNKSTLSCNIQTKDKANFVKTSLPCTHSNLCWIMNIRTYSLFLLGTFS